ncbi:5135_t:CDS:2 [Dentiscutata erythropus]|uniref:5135_t:CDS:1 n=1 Tax=Dentiscutata erythropus TaxID=1348616 RepID=A0A9N8WNR3_9GLOM|nr:5135_t:CDS:2 [Dentiscutata erythropus]
MTDAANARSASLVDSTSDSECLQEKSDEINNVNVSSGVTSNTDDIVGNGITIKITADNASIVNADATDDRQNNDKVNVSIDSQEKKILDSQDDEAVAFKSQFDEISNISRMLENAKANNNSYNNRYHGSPGRMHSGFSSNYLSSQRRVNVRSHHRSLSHPSLPTRHTLQNKRNPGSFYAGHHRLASLPSPYTGIPYSGFDLSGQDEDLHLSFDDPLTMIDDSSSKFDSDWDMSSPISSTPGFPSSPSSIDPFASPLSPNNLMNSLLDDDELAERQLMLEEERKILQMKRHELDNAIYKLHYQNNFESNLNHSLSSLIETKRGSSSTTPSLSRQTSFSKNLSPQQPRFQPIGPPIKKLATCDYSVSSTMSSSAPSQSTFSLFSKSPSLSLNHTFLPTVNEQRLSNVLNDEKLNDFSLTGYPLTPSGTPPKYVDRDYLFPSPFHYSANHLSPKIWSNHNDASHSKSFRTLPKRDYYSAPTTPNYYTPPTPQFNRSSQHALNQLSIGHFTKANSSSLYSSPVDERDELWHGDEAFNPILTPPEISSMNKFSPSINNDENNLLNKNSSCHQLHNIVQPKLFSSTHKIGGDFFSLVGNQAASDSHYDGLTHDKGMRINGLYKLEVM